MAPNLPKQFCVVKRFSIECIWCWVVINNRIIWGFYLILYFWYQLNAFGINFFSFGLKLMHFANGIKFGKTSPVLEVKEPCLFNNNSPGNFSRFQMLLISTHFKFIYFKVLWICFGLTGKSRQPQKSCWYTKLSKILPQLIRFGSLGHIPESCLHFMAKIKLVRKKKSQKNKKNLKKYFFQNLKNNF